MSSHTASSAGGHPKNGELVELDYELWADAPNGGTELIDTTREAVAAKANANLPEGHTLGPRAHQIGGEFFPSGIENALLTAEVGTEFTKEFPPAEAFGERDPKLIELFSMHEISRLPEMRRDDAELNVGTVITVNGRRGRVVSMTAARVRVDFNPPLAGRTVKGTFKIVKAIDDPAEQVRGILDIQYGRGKEFEVEVKGQHVAIQVPDRSKFDFAWMAAKPRIIERIRSTVKPQTIQLIEEYKTPPAKEAAVEGPAPAGTEKMETPRETGSETTRATSDGEQDHAGHAHAHHPKKG
jgi:FKBP-type peptidyl-prolyl cis-trans isomerase 2